MAAIVLPSLAFAVQKHMPLYMCGIATTFNDSTVYFTEIQKIDSAYVDSKTGFLYSRDSYSYQLREHMQRSGVAHPTCVTVFGKKRKDVEKKYAALKKRYATKGRYDVKLVSPTEFAYTPIIPDESEMQNAPKPQKVKKAKKSNKK